MTILQTPPRSATGHPGKRWYKFGRADEAVRHTDAWEHETFEEEQGRWERSDPEYAGICEQVRQARKRGGEDSWRADRAKAEWDARTATQRQAKDNAQKAHHALKADQTARRRPATSGEGPCPATDEPSPAERSGAACGYPSSGRFYMHTTFAIESNDSPAPGIIPEPVCVHDQPAATTARRAARGTTPFS